AAGDRAALAVDNPVVLVAEVADLPAHRVVTRHPATHPGRDHRAVAAVEPLLDAVERRKQHRWRERAAMRYLERAQAAHVWRLVLGRHGRQERRVLAREFGLDGDEAGGHVVAVRPALGGYRLRSGASAAGERE